MLEIVNLKTENLSKNCVTDVKNPRFAFALSSNKQDTTLKNAIFSVNDWESSGQAQCATYNGKELSPFTRYLLSVRAQDNNGFTAKKSMNFLTGRLDLPWRGKWITNSCYELKAACPKHFACNNQETARNKNDSRVSQRALREIYLKGFEICIKESSPLNIMVSYNKINGVWAHYSYDLATTILRYEWDYKGLVITDWWMQKSKSPEFPCIKDNAYRVRAQVDVLMPGNMKRKLQEYKSDGTLLKSLGKSEGITHAELVRTAKNTLNTVLKIQEVTH